MTSCWLDQSEESRSTVIGQKRSGAGLELTLMETRLREAKLDNLDASDKTRDWLMVDEMSLDGAAEVDKRANLASERKADLSPARTIIAIMRDFVKNSNEQRKFRN